MKNEDWEKTTAWRSPNKWRKNMMKNLRSQSGYGWQGHLDWADDPTRERSKESVDRQSMISLKNKFRITEAGFLPILKDACTVWCTTETREKEENSSVHVRSYVALSGISEHRIKKISLWRIALKNTSVGEPSSCYVSNKRTWKIYRIDPVRTTDDEKG